MTPLQHPHQLYLSSAFHLAGCSKHVIPVALMLSHGCLFLEIGIFGGICQCSAASSSCTC